jgi:cell division protein FtsQ
MTRKRAEPERNRRIVDAPTEAQGYAEDSPAPPMVNSPNATSSSLKRGSRGDAWVTIGRVIVTGLVLGGASAAAVLGTYRFAQTSPRFSVRQIDIDGLRRKTREEVLSLGHLNAGTNVFAVDTAAVERAILTEPWIREVRVERRLPATIRVELVEREAGALAMIGEQILVVTRTGEPFKRYEPTDPADLPVITGVSVDEPGQDPALERRRIATALEILRHYERTNLARAYAAEEVHLTPGGDAILTVGKSGVALHLGAGPWAKKLAMAERVMGKLRGQLGSVSMVFLDNRAHPERVVVRMR